MEKKKARAFLMMPTVMYNCIYSLKNCFFGLWLGIRNGMTLCRFQGLTKVSKFKKVRVNGLGLGWSHKGSDWHVCRLSNHRQTWLFYGLTIAKELLKILNIWMKSKKKY